MHRIKYLPNINNKLYIYATPSGVLAITSDLNRLYYSVYLDGVEPTTTGLFVSEYPKDFNNINGYGAPCDASVIAIFKDFEECQPGKVVSSFDICGPLFKGLSKRLLPFTLEYAPEQKPHTRFVCIDTAEKKASLVATDNKTLCAFGNIPVETSSSWARYFLSRDMISSVVNFPEADTATVTTIGSMHSQYKIQLIFGDFVFIEKQWMDNYPKYKTVITYYKEYKSPRPLTLTPDIIGKIKSAKPFAKDETCEMLKFADIFNIMFNEKIDSTAVYNKSFVEKVLDNLTSLSCEFTKGTSKEQSQIDCKFGKTGEYTQTLCVMPINPDVLYMKEIMKDTPREDEPVSSCNIKSIKNLI